MDTEGFIYATYAAGSLLGAASDIFSGETTRKISEYSANIQRYRIYYNKAVTDFKLAASQREFDKQLGSIRASAAARGLQADYGAPLELEIENEILHEINQEVLRITGGVENLDQWISAQSTEIAGIAASGAGYGRAAGKAIGAGLEIGRDLNAFPRKSLTAPASESPLADSHWMDTKQWRRD